MRHQARILGTGGGAKHVPVVRSRHRGGGRRLGAAGRDGDDHLGRLVGRAAAAARMAVRLEVDDGPHGCLRVWRRLGPNAPRATSGHSMALVLRWATGASITSDLILLRGGDTEMSTRSKPRETCRQPGPQQAGGRHHGGWRPLHQPSASLGHTASSATLRFSLALMGVP